MNTDTVLSGIVLVLFVTLLVVLHLARKARAAEQEPDVGADIFEPALAEDINAPSIAVIDAALVLTTDPAGRDWLLDRRIAAKRGASWPSI